MTQHQRSAASYPTKGTWLVKYQRHTRALQLQSGQDTSPGIKVSSETNQLANNISFRTAQI